MFPDAYAFCPASRLETATAAGAGAAIVAARTAARAGAGAAGAGVPDPARMPAATGGVVPSGERPVSMLPKPPSTTQPATTATVVQGMGRGGSASWRATSFSPHRRHLTRSRRTFAPHAAQTTAAAFTLPDLSPREDADADLSDTVVVVVRVTEHLHFAAHRHAQMLVHDERRGRARTGRGAHLRRVGVGDTAAVVRVVRRSTDVGERVEIRGHVVAAERRREERRRGEEHDITGDGRKPRDLLVVVGAVDLAERDGAGQRAGGAVVEDHQEGVGL